MTTTSSFMSMLATVAFLAASLLRVSLVLIVPSCVLWGSSSSFSPGLNLVRLAAKNGSSEGSARQSSVNHQLDRIDVRRIVRGKEEHRLGQIFRLAPTAKWNRGGEEVGKFCGFLLTGIGARPALPYGSLRRSGGHHVHANLARCKVCGDGSRHRNESAFRGSVGSHAWLTEIIVD